ncbi:MAG: methionine synthase, partial [Geminicoccaceae bacterium]
MRWSEERILTTHAGSLPRPPELVRLYARRAQGEAVDSGEIEAAGRAALRWVVPKQITAGVDLGNNGEQQREGFFLYVQHRMSGFGGSWQRRQRADILRYPMFQRMVQEQQAGRTAVSNFQPPKAIGPVHYLDPAFINAECDDFQVVLDQADGGFVEPFLTAPSPGIVAAAMKNEYYDTEEAYLAALADALRVEYE